jgi:hypothetical protein
VNPTRFALQKKFTRRGRRFQKLVASAAPKIGSAMAAFGLLHNKDQP